VIDQFILALLRREQDGRPFGREVLALLQQPDEFFALFGGYRNQASS